jgi:DNA-binding GntR family transcriptional regulator
MCIRDRPGRLAQSLAEHMAIFAALKARDAEGADAAMRTHLTRQREALRQLARQSKSRIAAVNTPQHQQGDAT